MNRDNPFNKTPAREPPQPSSSSSPALSQLAFSFGVPLAVLGAFHSLLKARLQLARLSGRPRLPGCHRPRGPCRFPAGFASTCCFC